MPHRSINETIMSIMKWKGHDKMDALTANGNEAADQAVKQKAGYSPEWGMIQGQQCMMSCQHCNKETIAREQEKAAQCDKRFWMTKGATQSEGLRRAPDGRPVLRPVLTKAGLKEVRGHSHCGTAQMRHYLSHWWHPYLPPMTDDYVKGFDIFDIKESSRCPHWQGKRLSSTIPWIHTAVQAYTGWPVYDAQTVKKFLVN